MTESKDQNGKNSWWFPILEMRGDAKSGCKKAAWASFFEYISLIMNEIQNALDPAWRAFLVTCSRHAKERSIRRVSGIPARLKYTPEPFDYVQQPGFEARTVDQVRPPKISEHRISARRLSVCANGTAASCVPVQQIP